MTTDLEKIIKAAKAGGAVAKKYYGQSIETTQKTNASNFVTKADLESEQAILTILEAEFPTYNVLAEERGEINKNSEFTFVVDPLDGTNNFVLGLPNFSVSIGLLQNDEIIMGVIYSPMIDNAYYAEKGQGAYCDGKPIHANQEADIKRSTICHVYGYGTHFSEKVKILTKLYSEGPKRVMNNWSSTFDFCMLACGRVEGIINNGSELYDFAAGKLIAKEGGALITDFSGQPETNDKNRLFLVSNGTTIHQLLVEVMSDK